MTNEINLANYVNGQWVNGDGAGASLINPVNGEEVARAGSAGIDIAAALQFARAEGNAKLQELTYAQRAACLARAAEVLTVNREVYYQLAMANSGNTAADAAFDVDGAIGTLKYYAGVGKGLGDTHYLVEPELDRLGRDPNFQAVHIHTALRGVAIHVNAFNFPAWGLWEKAAVSLLAGVPVFAKPATATSLLTQQMVRDVVDAQILPEGSLSVICGGGHDLMDHVRTGDVVFFTGSADTAAKLRSNPNVQASGVRFNVEADSVNLSLLGPDVESASPLFEAFIKEVAREMTFKAGQKCTAIRRILVPAGSIHAVAEALAARLAKTTVGDPREEGVRMGPLVNKSQQQAALEGIEILRTEASVVYGADPQFSPVGADAERGCFIQPTLLRCDNPLEAERVHDTEVFGPVATLMPYADESEAYALAALGGGSLAGSVFTQDDAFAARASVQLSSSHGRLLVIDESIMSGHSGHGVVMPQCVHGGPGRAGGGEELGGLRALRAYHQRTAVQGTLPRLEALVAAGASYRG
tara:strand:+ start:26971 stop:28551 length:1581 start_codon:yes stop_codon:yes gene_type:complete